MSSEAKERLVGLINKERNCLRSTCTELAEAHREISILSHKIESLCEIKWHRNKTIAIFQEEIDSLEGGV